MIDPAWGSDLEAPDIIDLDDVLTPELTDFCDAGAGIGAEPRHPFLHRVLLGRSRLEHDLGFGIGVTSARARRLLFTSMVMRSAGLVGSFRLSTAHCRIARIGTRWASRIVFGLNPDPISEAFQRTISSGVRRAASSWPIAFLSFWTMAFHA
ncbi:hypothetical protein WBO78_20785 [Bosea sp. CCNWLW174]|uniref:hypothetical protein n=1 Tax=unclassified Bosea (in: a-proteobacteria) TaxID=2653178 RepID=UPI0030148795